MIHFSYLHIFELVIIHSHYRHFYFYFDIYKQILLHIKTDRSLLEKAQSYGH